MYEHQRCRACTHATLEPLLCLGTHTAHGMFYRRNQPKPPQQTIEVVRCAACGLNQQRYSLPVDAQFKHYFYRSGISQTMRDHLTLIATEAAAMLEPTVAPRCLDIGGNDGTLLNALPLATPHRVVLEPSDVSVVHPGISRITGFFPQDMLLAEPLYHLIFSIACFYSNNDPLGFMKGIKRLLLPNGLWCVEIADWYAVMKNAALDYWVTEHQALYSPKHMHFLGIEAGLRLVRVEPSPCNGGSTRYYFAHLEHDGYRHPEWQAKVDAFLVAADSFQLDDRIERDWVTQVLANLDKLKSYLAAAAQAGRAVHVLGGSTKMSLYLQAVGSDAYPLRWAADRDPRKEGLLIPGTQIEICSEAASRDQHPAAYLSNLYFRDELIARERAAGSVAELVFLPHIDVVSLN